MIDAVAATLERMSEETAAEVIRFYFCTDGIGYRFIRTYLDSCDFSTDQYAAITAPNGKEFATFSIYRFKNRVIRWIQEVYKAAGENIPVIQTWPMFSLINEKTATHLCRRS